MVCLDSDFLIDLMRKDKRALEKLKEFIKENTSLTTTYITACELFKGAYRTEKYQETSKKVKLLLESLEILDFSLSACQTFGKLSNDLKMIGEEIGDMDTLIASIVLTHNEILVTKNIKHFEKIPNLIVEIW